jgi:hypothetical protein
VIIAPTRDRNWLTAICWATSARSDHRPYEGRNIFPSSGYHVRFVVPGSGGITYACQRLGYEPMKELFAEVAAPVAEELTAGAFLGPWRLMATGGSE